jgi:hypothetical protein
MKLYVAVFAGLAAARLPDTGHLARLLVAALLLGSFALQDVRADPEPEPLAVKPELLPYKYVGNSFSLKFHRPSCPFAKAMHYSRLTLFHFRKEAITAGMKPCRYCLPPSWGTLKGTILPQESVVPNVNSSDSPDLPSTAIPSN